MVIRKIPIYNFKNNEFNKFENTDFLSKNFYISLPVLPQKFDKEKTLLLIPGSLEIRVIKRSYNDGSEDNKSINREGCFYFNEQNEWILEAHCHMKTDDNALKQTFIIRLPLSAPFVKDSRIGLYFDRTWIRFMKDGEVLNQNSGLDEFCKPEGEIYLDNCMAETVVSKIDEVNITYKEIKSNSNADFFFPHGWNTSIGDVMTFTHNGVYHLIYLLDRRHHGSGPCGSHYICQMTSENLIDWYEQKPITEITKPWISYGTGTMFFHNGKYYMTYGLHTERYNNLKEKVAPKYDENNGYEHLRFEDIYKNGGIPAGGTYSVSDDGINFTPSEILIHAARNPSGYINEKGGITLYCGYCGDGVFESSDINTPFKKSDMNFDFALNSPMRNTTECPALFEWNGYKYLAIGFSGYFRTLSPDSDKFVDVATMDENIYDGLSVPMVTSFGDNRRIIAGWVCGPLGWGGVLMQRELIQEKGGKLGMKWIPELFPKLDDNNFAENRNVINEGLIIEKDKSYYLEMQINPQDAKRFALSFDDGENACTFELDLIKKRVQTNDAEIGLFAKEIPTLYEAMLKDDKNAFPYKNTDFSDYHTKAKNYTLPDIIGNGKPFTLKMLIRRSKKMQGTVLDAEIDGRRTMISVRNDFYPTNISVLTEGEISLNATILKTFEFEE